MRVGFIGFFESIVCDISNFLFVCLFVLVFFCLGLLFVRFGYGWLVLFLYVVWLLSGQLAMLYGYGVSCIILMGMDMDMDSMIDVACTTNGFDDVYTYRLDCRCYDMSVLGCFPWMHLFLSFMYIVVVCIII